jgi:kelch-like protein 10
MNIYRSALSACVITGLPNIYDYIYKQRDRLLEERYRRLWALETQRNQQDEQQDNQEVDDSESSDDSEAFD